MNAGARRKPIDKNKLLKATRRIADLDEAETMSAREAIELMRPAIEEKRKVVPLVDIVKQVADDLGVSPTTVEFYLFRSRGKRKKK